MYFRTVQLTDFPILGADMASNNDLLIEWGLWVVKKLRLIAEQSTMLINLPVSVTTRNMSYEGYCADRPESRCYRQSCSAMLVI